jgi:hypothetical protein
VAEARKEEIPNGACHLGFILGAAIQILAKAAKHSDLSTQYKREMIGTCLNALYQGGTCYRKCQGGSHLFERMSGRAYNLACGAYYLSVIGLYDESLNLTRDLGELTNLFALSALDHGKFQEWSDADRKTRLNKFSPKKVRDMLKRYNINIIVTDEWYKDMSEEYTHVTPETVPNTHGGQPWIGVKYEKAGEDETLGALMSVSMWLGMFVCHRFGFNDLLDDIVGKMTISSEKPAET